MKNTRLSLLVLCIIFIFIAGCTGDGGGGSGLTSRDGIGPDRDGTSGGSGAGGASTASGPSSSGSGSSGSSSGSSGGGTTVAMGGRAEGNEGGTGGDTLSSEDGSAWFLTPASAPKYISVCYEKNSDFKASDETIKKAISTAVDDWEVYIIFKGIVISSGDGKNKWRPTVAFSPSTVGNTYMSDSDSISGNCTGTENLKFIFGSSSSREVNRARSMYKNPIAFASRQNFDLKKGLGNGFVWVAPEGHFSQSPEFPNWKEESLTAILAHELGHVLGCDHVSGTIMREDILNFIKVRETAEWNPIPLFKINQERELLLSQDSDLLRPTLSLNEGRNAFQNMHEQSYAKNGKIPQKGWQTDDQLFFGWLDSRKESDQPALKAFWGEPLQSPHVKLEERIERRPLDNAYEFIITFKDGWAFKQYIVKTPRNPIQTKSEAKVFRMAVGSFSRSYEGGTSEIYNGELVVDGKNYSIMIQRNSLNPLAGLSVWFNDGKSNNILFYPDPQEGLWTNLLE